jgi:hypothetical protein
VAQAGWISARRVTAAILAALVAGVLLSIDSTLTSAATPKAVTIAVSPTSGPPGLRVTISGSGYSSGTTYGLCILPAGKTKCGYEGANLIGGVPSEQFTAAADGTIPSGTAGIIPDLVAGAYRVVSTAPSTGFIVASADFTVTAPTFALNPTAGPGGTTVSVSLSGAAANTTYTICSSPKDSGGCIGTGILLGDVTTDASGSVASGTTVVLPGQLPATYQIGVYLANGNNTFLASVAFQEVAPTFSLGASSGQEGAAIPVTGSGFVPGVKYLVCLFTADATSCGGGVNLVGFQADASGAIPAGVNATIPANQTGQRRIGVTTETQPWYLASSPFEVLAGTAPPPTPTGAPPAALTPGVQTAAPAPSAAPTGSEGSGGFGVPLILVAILAVVLIAAGFWFSRRRAKDGSATS